MNNNTVWKDRKHFMWFPWSFTRYSADKNRLYEDVGLLNTRHDEVLLYRVVDISMTRSLAQKIFGTGTITLHTKSGEEHKITGMFNKKLISALEKAGLAQE